MPEELELRFERRNALSGLLRKVLQCLPSRAVPLSDPVRDPCITDGLRVQSRFLHQVPYDPSRLEVAETLANEEV